MAKKKTAKAPEGLVGYCMKTKQKELMLDVEIYEKSGKHIAAGVNGEGDKITLIMSEAQAKEAITKGWATKRKATKKK